MDPTTYVGDRNLRSSQDTSLEKLSCDPFYLIIVGVEGY